MVPELIAVFEDDFPAEEMPDVLGQSAITYPALGAAVVPGIEFLQLLELAKRTGKFRVYPNRIRTVPTDPSLRENGGCLNALITTVFQSVSRARGFVTGRRRRIQPLADHGWWLSMMGIGQDYTKATGKGVRVAVLDTGIDMRHPAFPGLKPDNLRSFVSGADTVQDGHGHGTHCAGLVCGRPVTGMRFGAAPDAELLVCKVLDDNGSGTDSSILQAMQWALERGANIISMSLGSDRYKNQPPSEAFERIGRRLLRNGCLVVAAAGNASNRPFGRQPVGDPAACPSIMAVAACDQRGQVAPFSSAELDKIGTLDITAPGVDIMSAIPGGGLRSMSGTSMATPLAAGVAALWQQYARYSGQNLWDRLVQSAKKMGAHSDFGHGLVQAP